MKIREANRAEFIEELMGDFENGMDEYAGYGMQKLFAKYLLSKGYQIDEDSFMGNSINDIDGIWSFTDTYYMFGDETRDDWQKECEEIAEFLSLGASKKRCRNRWVNYLEDCLNFCYDSNTKSYVSEERYNEVWKESYYRGLFPRLCILRLCVLTYQMRMVNRRSDDYKRLLACERKVRKQWARFVYDNIVLPWGSKKKPRKMNRMIRRHGAEWKAEIEKHIQWLKENVLED